MPHDVGNALDPPASMGQARPYFPPEEWNSEEYERVNGALDKERDDYLARCEAYESLTATVEFPPSSELPNLDAERAEVEAELAKAPDNVTLKGLRAYVIERQCTLANRVEATVPREWLERVVAAINAAVEKYTGIPQTATLPRVENTAKFIRDCGCRA